MATGLRILLSFSLAACLVLGAPAPARAACATFDLCFTTITDCLSSGYIVSLNRFCHLHCFVYKVNTCGSFTGHCGELCFNTNLSSGTLCKKGTNCFPTVNSFQTRITDANVGANDTLTFRFYCLQKFNCCGEKVQLGSSDSFTLLANALTDGPQTFTVTGVGSFTIAAEEEVPEIDASACLTPLCFLSGGLLLLSTRMAGSTEGQTPQATEA